MEKIFDITINFIREIINWFKNIFMISHTLQQYNKRIEKLENELQKAIERADNNIIHCPQCGGDVKILYTTITPNVAKYYLECKECGFKNWVKK